MPNNFVWEVGDYISDLEHFRNIVMRKRLRTDQDETDFLAPKFELADPFLLTDMDRAVKRIGRAIDKREKILIYGDYDADGVTSLALLYELLKFFGVEPEVYIPDRLSEGYGLKYSVLKRFFEEGTTLVITVDCGIRDIEVAKKTLMLGLDLIITDHHELGPKVPEAYATINPKRSHSQYPERELAGVGVVYALARGLMKYLAVEEKRQESWLKWNLDLVAVGTVADMVPLLGENRVLVKYGLIVLAKSQKRGLRELLNVSGIKDKKLTSWDIGFGLAPRINATGRIDDASHSFNLLIENGQLEAEILARNIEAKNQERKTLTEEIWVEVQKKIESEELPACIMLVNDHWSKGILGLIASKAIRQYNRPTIIATYDEDNIVGSARSISGINVVKLLDNNSRYLSQFGGHEKAAGLTLSKEDWSDFFVKINDDVQKLLENEDLRPKLKIDAQIDLSLIDKSLVKLIENLHPFGVENEEPILLSRDCLVQKSRLIGKNNNHFKLVFNFSDGKEIEGIIWNRPELSGLINNGDIYDVVYNLRKNVWQGRENYLLNIIDFKKKDEE